MNAVTVSKTLFQPPSYPLQRTDVSPGGAPAVAAGRRTRPRGRGGAAPRLRAAHGGQQEAADRGRQHIQTGAGGRQTETR